MGGGGTILSHTFYMGEIVVVHLSWPGDPDYKKCISQQKKYKKKTGKKHVTTGKHYIKKWI